ncbi:hypothetical protein EAG_09011 [Camponotus floridanus]|uniref:Uncharacterized protein n=1 Tax=Camponotus floridanus TaxID=104421 RepID=E2AQT8_CAMFO|nr:hypothetical protein EAG_09011 [Camponotus floridanus]
MHGNIDQGKFRHVYHAPGRHLADRVSNAAGCKQTKFDIQGAYLALNAVVQRLKTLLQAVNPLESIAKRRMCQGPHGAHPCPQDTQARQVSNTLYLCPRFEANFLTCVSRHLQQRPL